MLFVMLLLVELPYTCVENPLQKSSQGTTAYDMRLSDQAGNFYQIQAYYNRTCASEIISQAEQIRPFQSNGDGFIPRLTYRSPYPHLQVHLPGQGGSHDR